MAVTTIDDIGYDDVREVGLHKDLEQAVKGRFEFELAKRLDQLGSEKEREESIVDWDVQVYRDSERERNDCGLVMNWEKFDNIYIPRKWKEYMMDKSRPWNSSFIGMLSHDECILSTTTREEDVFNKTILYLPALTNIYFFVSYSDWRKNVMQYARWRLHHIATNLRTEKPGYKDNEQTRELVRLLIPLADRYNREIE